MSSETTYLNLIQNGQEKTPATYLEYLKYSYSVLDHSYRNEYVYKNKLFNSFER